MSGYQAAFLAPGRALLGIDARSSDGLEGAKEAKSPAEQRTRGGRFKLLDVVRRLMFAPGRAPDRQARVCRCHYSRKSATVKVRLDARRGKAHFAGLETCSNVWICPVCSGAITDERRAELQRAAGYWKAQGGEI